MPHPKIHFLHAPSVDAATLAAMWTLYAPHHAITRDEFFQRCREGVDELAVYRVGGAVVGFTGVRRRTVTLADGEVVATAYFGASFIDAAWRGHNLIQRTVLRVFAAAKGRHPLRRLFVWSDALTVRPYLLTARNLREYYPSPLRVLPPDIRELRDALGRIYYGEDYECERGTVRKPSRKLAAPLLDVADVDDLHVRFYVEQNPRYVDGHGLLIVQPATLANALAFAGIQLGRLVRRVWGRRTSRALRRA
jgi:hypothetical protein